MILTKYYLLNILFSHSRRSNYLFCVECGYVHPGDAGLEEGDFCPDCGRGVLVEI